ncbi:ROK family transcriptional regulator [Tengunoibacter tsumagoiensis]|uniref:Transcriptional regulator n=1 Tax=Tengunoibacter tsumagoiensis TaxID=2014871 RepID=A0A402AAQ9_9CHLR|nr:ROK family transcriptional regulator [Tengunoibacter tsumagoiensis]GCE16188.1 transcriptional regulator [Tengunoibacter tsumagoiensis]
MEQARQQRQQKAHAHESRIEQQGADFHQVREFNRLLVLNYIRQHGPTARITIAQQLGLSRTTVTNIMGSLLQEGLVREGEQLDATAKGGRRATLVHFRAEAGFALGIDIEHLQLIIVVTDLEAHVVMQWSGPFDLMSLLGEGPQKLIDSLTTSLQEVLTQAHITWDQIIGIGISLPEQPEAGPSQSMLQWNSTTIQRLLREHWQKPLCIEKNATLGMLGEYRRGVGRNHTTMAYIMLDFEIAGSILINGNIYRGPGGNVIKIAHLMVDKDGPRCQCGKYGCLEAVASTQAILYDATHGLSLARKFAQDGLNAPSLTVNATQKKNLFEVIQAAKQGDQASLAAIHYAGTCLGQALGSLINLLNPLLIVLNGEITKAGELFFQPMHKAAEAASLSCVWQETRIIAGELGVLANALGGALLVIDTAFTLSTISSTFSVHSSS